MSRASSISLPAHWSVSTWSPGDGATRYRFFYGAPASQMYHDPNDPVFTALGLKEANAFAAGVRAGVRYKNPALGERQDPRRRAKKSATRHRKSASHPHKAASSRRRW